MRKKSEETSEKVVKNIPTSENGAGNHEEHYYFGEQYRN